MKIKSIRHIMYEAMAIIRGQIFLFPRLNTRLLRIFGRVRLRGGKSNLVIGRRVIFRGDAQLICGWGAGEGGIELQDGVVLEHGCYLNAHGGSITLEKHGFVGVGAIIQGRGMVRLGEDVMLGPYVQIYSSDHPVELAEEPRRMRPEIASPVVIERNVWIGAGSIILRGTVLPRGSVVAAGSVLRTQHDKAAVFASKGGLATPVKPL